jgi:hypothetical protein
MAKPNQATRTKRDRERMRAERQQEKTEKRSMKGETKEDRKRQLADGIDPDLAGIVAGPQAPSLD